GVQLADLDGLAARAPPAAQFDFLLNLANGFRRNTDEFDSDANARQAIADLAASVDLRSGKRQAEPQIEHRTFREPRRRIDEHSVNAYVRRANGHLFGPSFVVDRDFLYRMNSRTESAVGPKAIMIVRFHSLATPISTAFCGCA